MWPVSLTTNTADPADSVTEVSLTAILATSLSFIVPIPRPSAMVALTGLERFRSNVSEGSTRSSSVVGMVIVVEVVPAVIVYNVELSAV